MNALNLAVRSLLKSPGFAVTAIVTLALGIGANTAMFSLLNTFLLRPLPFPRSNELVRVWRTSERTQRGGSSAADFLDLQRAGAEVGQFAAYLNQEIALSTPHLSAETARLMSVSAGFFTVLEVQPQLGRSFHADEEIHGDHRVLLLNHDTWQNRFGGAADVLGRIVRVDGEPHEIIGVLPVRATERRPLSGQQFFRPLGLTEADRASRSHITLNLLGRRKSTVSDATLAAFLKTFGQNLARDFPEANRDTGLRTESLAASALNPTGHMIVLMLLGLSGSVLLIACSNLANLLLARTISRAREFAVRAALGASRRHLILPLAWEAIVLALTGGVAALLVSHWTTNWLSAESARFGDTPVQMPVDGRVLGFAFAAAFLTALFFGIAPALLALRVNLNDTLKRTARGTTASRGHRRLRSLLIIGQFALASIILAGAGYFIGGARNLLHQEFGWDAAHVIQGGFDLPKARYPGPEEILAFQRQTAERFNALPGVTAASFSYSLPYSSLSGERSYVVEGRDLPAPGREPKAGYNGISPDYFTVTGTRLLRGRTFGEGDNAASPRVVIISESFARTFFPGQNPLGGRIARAVKTTPQWMEIVGVVVDIRTPQTNQVPNAFQVYHPFAQEPWHRTQFAVRTTGVAPETLFGPIRKIATSLDVDLPVRDLMTAEQRFERTASDLFLVNTLLGAFALLALGLAALGIYGVIARTVAQRTSEFGIRLALGARRGHIIGLVLRTGVRLAVIGSSIGILGGFGLNRVLAAGLPGLPTSGGAVLAGVTAVLIAIALLASYLPARRTARIDPVEALRAE